MEWKMNLLKEEGSQGRKGELLMDKCFASKAAA
jgi:hypothetical protein